MKPGYTDDKGRTYFRCQECGDSPDPTKAHAFVDYRGDTHCWKCSHSSSMSMDQWLYVQLNVADIEEVISVDWIPFDLDKLFPMGRRTTLLDRYVVPNNVAAEAFSMRNSRGSLIGYHSRYPGKIMLNEGARGICWPGADDDDQLALTSSETNPLYVVEGPYDCTMPRRVSAMGSLSPTVFRHLQNQNIWAWPDPDILNTTKKRAQFVKMLNVANDNNCWVQGIVISDKDPDTCTTKYKLTLAQANEYVRNECSLIL